jgi:O-acetyl-ADP-ribose deacetylase (regulator of RNase III)
MLSFHNGDLFSAKTDALVNTVNCVGVMGKGIAAQFKSRYPDMFVDYLLVCQRKELRPGKLHVYFHTWVGGGVKIISFPTKLDWRNPSKYAWIDVGLARLFAITIPAWNIKSIAIPALGCANGGLQWDKVKSLIQKWYHTFDDLVGSVDVKVYEPL